MDWLEYLKQSLENFFIRAKKKVFAGIKWRLMYGLRIPSWDVIEQKGERISNSIFYFLKILIIFVLILYIFALVCWIFDKDEGIVVQPFEMVGIGGNLDSEFLATSLYFDLQRIKDIYNESYLPRNNYFTIYSGMRRTPIVTSIPSLINEKSLDYSISGLGTVGWDKTGLSVGNVVHSLKELIGNRPNTISCSLQRDNSTITLMAMVYNHSSKSIRVFKLTQALNEDNRSLDELIQSLINDLAIQVSHEMSKLPPNEKNFPQNWQTFKYLTQGREDYHNYIIAEDNDSLNKAKNMAFSAINSEPLYRGSYELLTEVGFKYIASENYNESLNIFHNISDQMPFESALGIGLVYNYQSNYKKSLIALTQASILNPNSTLAWFNLASALCELGKYDEANKAYDKAINLDRNYSLPWFGKGYLFFKQGKYNESIQAYDKYIELDPKAHIPH